MPKEKGGLDQGTSMQIAAYGFFILFIFVVIVASYLSIQNQGLQGKVTTLQNNLSVSRLNASLWKSDYTTLNATYQIVNRNLTTPYRRNYFTDYNIKIPAAVYNTTFDYATYSFVISNYTPGIYNFSAVFPYPGYVILNYTTTAVQDPNYSNFTIYISQEKPYNDNGLVFSRYYMPYSTYGGASNKQAEIPVLNGTNYFLFYNNNPLDSVDVTFTLQYVGYHTK